MSKRRFTVGKPFFHLSKRRSTVEKRFFICRSAVSQLKNAFSFVEASFHSRKTIFSFVEAPFHSGKTIFSFVEAPFHSGKTAFSFVEALFHNGKTANMMLLGRKRRGGRRSRVRASSGKPTAERNEVQRSEDLQRMARPPQGGNAQIQMTIDNYRREIRSLFLFELRENRMPQS
ncbi:MAG: hypothetical protein LBU44_00005 [Mediterranea sp.]|nr:hypothetical protein [Mediterranea sp.]